jgi:predicted phosphodiesterase
MVKIQIVSDIHLEFRGENFQKIIKPSAPILFLLGDICACGTTDDFNIYKKFITFISTKFKYIFHVPGNHEYYTVGNKNITVDDTIIGIDNKIRNFTKEFNNVLFLNNNVERLKIGKKTYVFIGSTLWTYINPSDRKLVAGLMNDYQYIYMNSTPKKQTIKQNPIRKFNVDDMSIMHTNSVKYITDEMKNIKPDEVAILLTHHKPIKDSNTKDPINQAYESDLKDIIIHEPFKLACFGHTHVKYNKIINNVTVISNPKGYISQKTKFDDSLAIDV